MNSDLTQIFSVHDLAHNASVDVLVVFDRDWSDTVPIPTGTTFIVWDRRPSFAIEVGRFGYKQAMCTVASTLYFRPV